jgi:ribosomal protein S18 acetylase RimI-like enzyme
MEEILIRAARADDFPVIAQWIVAICQVPAQQCLHSWAGEDAEALCSQLLKIWNDKELLYRIASREGEMVGVMGSEYDEALGSAWLHGPNVADAYWQATAPLLFSRVVDALPRPISQLNAYLNSENTRGVRFYHEREFEENGYACDYSLAASDRLMEGHLTCVPLQEEQQEAFIRLYETIFPEGYYSGERIVSMIGRTHQVFTRVDAGALRGFVVTTADAGSTIGEIQFLGVQEGWRGRGFGRNLSMAGVNWLFEQTGVAAVSLNVREEESQPRRLYESVGFQPRFRGTALRKTLQEREV